MQLRINAIGKLVERTTISDWVKFTLTKATVSQERKQLLADVIASQLKNDNKY